MVESEEEPATETTVPISGTVRIGHHVGETILNTVEQYDSDADTDGLGWLALPASGRCLRQYRRYGGHGIHL